MEIIIIIVGVLGSIASIIGAFLSIRAKKSSENSAKIAENAKNEILKKQKTTDLGSILFEAKRVQQVFGKYSITQSNRSLVGVEFSEDAKNLQKFIFNFNESRAIIEDNTDIETERIYRKLDDLLSEFSVSNISDKVKNGKQIRFIVDDIIFKMKRVIDNRNED